MKKPDHQNPSWNLAEQAGWSSFSDVQTKDSQPQCALHVVTEVDPSGSSGSSPVLVYDDPVALYAADLSGIKAYDGYLGRWHLPRISGQRPIAHRQMRSLFVIVDQIFLLGTAESSEVQEPTVPGALGLHRADPTLDKSVQNRATRWGRYQGDASSLDDALPLSAELGVTVVDQVLAADLHQPTSLMGNLVSRYLGHVDLVGMFGLAHDLNLPGADVDGEQDIIVLLAHPAPDLDGKEIRFNKTVDMAGEELFPSRIGATLRSRPQATVHEDGGDRPNTQADTPISDPQPSPPILGSSRQGRGCDLNHALPGDRLGRLSPTLPPGIIEYQQLFLAAVCARMQPP